MNCLWIKKFQHFIFLFSLIFSFACSSGDTPSSDAGVQTLKPDETPAVSQKPEDQSLPEHAVAPEDSDSDKAMGLKTVFFAYDSFTLDKTAHEVLKKNAEIFKTQGHIKVQIEGHCDQRGGIQYNLALGEKRANTIKHILINKFHIEEDRLSIISYGKEHLLDTDTTEEAYAKNRRGNFVIIGQ